MDHEAPDAHGGELRITVEAAAPAPGAHPNAATATRRRTGPPPCPHRIRPRDLNPTGRLRYTAGLLVLLTAWPVQIIGLFLGGFLLSLGAGFAGHFPITAGLALILGAMLTTAGLFAAHLTWKRPHQPDQAMLWISTAGAFLTLFGTALLGRWIDWHWTTAFTVPAALVAGLLWYLRTVLDHRDDCDTRPDLPPQVKALLKPAP